MKFIPFLLLLAVFSCGSGSKPLNLKNVRPGNLQFFEVYSTNEISDDWLKACKISAEMDTSAQQEQSSLQQTRGLSSYIQIPMPNSIGYIKESDIPAVDSILARPEIAKLFPKDLRFMWDFASDDLSDQGIGKVVALYTVKVPRGNKAIIDGRHIQTAETAISEYTKQPVIRITMTDKGANDWEVMTTKNVGLPIAITIDNHVLSCPVVNGAISGGETEISGNFSYAEAEELAARIQLGK